MTEPKGDNLHWHEGHVTRQQRHELLGQKGLAIISYLVLISQGVTIWFTGLSGCGKSTLAVSLESRLISMNKLSYRLDGDNIRLGINSDLGFSAKDRTENIRRIGEISKLMADSGTIVLCSFISPYQVDRDQIRQIHLTAGLPFYEIHLDCPLEVAESRDPKGLYQKARAGLIPRFTGISDPYEPPQSPEIHIHTDQLSLEEATDHIMKKLAEDRILTPH
jgi:adenylylsulfate kinase